MCIVVAVIKASVHSSIGCNLKFFGQEPIASVRHSVQYINFLLINLSVYEFIVVSPLIMCHVRFETLLVITIYKGLQTIGVI